MDQISNPTQNKKTTASVAIIRMTGVTSPRLAVPKDRKARNSSPAPITAIAVPIETVMMMTRQNSDCDTSLS